jgi:hypothetical protein
MPSVIEVLSPTSRPLPGESPRCEFCGQRPDSITFDLDECPTLVRSKGPRTRQLCPLTILWLLRCETEISSRATLYFGLGLASAG